MRAGVLVSSSYFTNPLHSTKERIAGSVKQARQVIPTLLVITEKPPSIFLVHLILMFIRKLPPVYNKPYIRK